MLARLMDSHWFPVYYLLVLVCTVVAGIFLSRKLHFEESANRFTSGVMSSIIGLFSLMLAFTLSSSSESNKTRISFMQQHRGAVANLYRLSFLFDDSLRLSVKEYVVKAVEFKLACINNSSSAAITELDRKSSIFNNVYLRSMSILARNNSRTHTGAKTIADEMSKIIDLDARVHYSNRERTPSVVMMLLLCGSWTIGLLMGMSCVLFRKTFYLGPIVFIALTSLTVLIIQDMDNPHRGLVRPPYIIYQDLLDEIKAETVTLK